MLLPTPGESFEWRDYAGRPALVCVPLLRLAAHLFTTSMWRLGSRERHHGDRDGWSEIAEALALDEVRLVRARQVHGVAVITGTSALAGDVPPDADIILVGDPEAGAAVQAADCVPMLVADSATGAVAAVHAGWRGMMRRAPQVAIAALTREFAIRPEDLHVALGPSIGGCCYEVGGDVRAACLAAGFSAEQVGRWFADTPHADVANPSLPQLAGWTPRSDRWFFDGWAAVREQIIEAGVPPEHVYVPAMCTASHPDVFCSYRRDGAPAGRIVGAIRSGVRV